MKRRLKWILLALTVALALLALWQVQKIAATIRAEEQEKVRLWAAAVSQRARMVEATQRFFDEATLDEHRKMELYTNILQSFNDPNMNTDFKFSLAYVNYIIDSARTPIIITTARDSIITVPQELVGQKLEGPLMDEYSVNPPFHYKIYGMPMTLYYKESQYYTQLREMLDGLMRSLIGDITQNSVKVPVLVVDSAHTRVLASGNMEKVKGERLKVKGSGDTEPSSLASQLSHFSNDPIEITLPDGTRAYVYYADTDLLRSLRWLPLFYFFIAAVLLVVSYYLFRTARSDEQNRIWVGMAKETAHQLGTPLSSLMAWTEMLKGKTLTEQYSAEIQKDIHRLETITHRFSKIGSVPELKEESVSDIVSNTVTYLQGRLPRKVKIITSLPEDDKLTAPINRYLFEWVIENLCKNAADAMDGAGTITIVASQDARKIYLDVSDTGRGMTPAVQRRIFDSGFTTKSRGWGLGLPLARRIVNQYHRGRLYLKYSVPGQGSTFRIALNKKG